MKINGDKYAAVVHDKISCAYVHAFLLPPGKSPALETLLELHVLLIIIFSTRIVHME
jgi:hypothetical protein